jgi:hypothetical protein
VAPTTPPPSPHGLLRNRRLLGLLISGGLVILVVAGVIGFSGAYFTSNSQSPGNEFAAAGMTLTLKVQGQIIDGAGMLPGDTRSGQQTVTNTGHRGLLVLEAKDLTSTRLTRVLNLTVLRDDGSSVTVYDGPLLDLRPLELGAMERDESRHYTFRMSWPEQEDSPELSEATTSFTFAWRLDSLP